MAKPLIESMNWFNIIQDGQMFETPGYKAGLSAGIEWLNDREPDDAKPFFAILSESKRPNGARWIRFHEAWRKDNPEVMILTGRKDNSELMILTEVAVAAGFVSLRGAQTAQEAAVEFYFSYIEPDKTEVTYFDIDRLAGFIDGATGNH